jgi:hypothetical protein
MVAMTRLAPHEQDSPSRFTAGRYIFALNSTERIVRTMLPSEFMVRSLRELHVARQISLRQFGPVPSFSLLFGPEPFACHWIVWSHNSLQLHLAFRGLPDLISPVLAVQDLRRVNRVTASGR